MVSSQEKETDSRELTIETVPGRLMFSPRFIQVKPGESLRLTVKNNGSVTHNLVICSEGVDNWKEVSNLVIDLGETMLSRNFDPGPPLVTHGTALILPGEEATLDWRAPQAEGVYSFLSSVPGHAPLMRGELQVSTASPGLTNLHYHYYQGKWSDDPDFTKIKARASGALDGPAIDFSAIPELESHMNSRKPGEQSAIVVTADIDAKLRGDYTFALASSSPASLSISDAIVVTHDGKSGATRFGKMELVSPEPTTELAHMKLEVISDKALITPRLWWRGPGGRIDLSVAGKFAIASEDLPHAITVPMQGASPLALAVALPGDANYCFDPETLSVRYAWTGGLVDARPVNDDGSGRIGGNVMPLGNPVSLGADSGFPLRIGGLAEDAPKVTYLGHTDGSETEPLALLFQVGDYTVTQKVAIVRTDDTPESIAVTYAFNIEPAPAAGVAIVFSADPDEVNVTTTDGFARNGVAVLRLQRDTSEVTVELRPMQD